MHQNDSADPIGKGSHKPFALSRRGFLKTAGAVTGATALAGAVPGLTALAQTYEVGQPSNEGEEIFRGTCRPNCFGFCHVNLHVRDGRVVKTSRAPYSNPQYSRICHRGLSHVQRIYDPERIKYPLRRAEGTERGAGEWERIEWDEAFKTIASWIKEVQDKYGPQAFAVHQGSSSTSTLGYLMYNRLFTLAQACVVNLTYDIGNNYGMRRLTGNGNNLWESNEQTDMINANAIVCWGANVTDAQVHSWHFIKEAMQAGKKLVVVDPTYTYLASKADLWVPVRPGADMPIYMAIMYIIQREGVEDAEYLRANTCAPFLVRSDTGKFLRRSDTGVAPTDTGNVNPQTGAPIMYDPYLVLDADGSLVPLEDATEPALRGEYAFEGVPCTTAYSLLLAEVEKFPPSRAAEIADVSEDLIEELAKVCMDTPVYHYIGYGPQAHMNGAHTCHAGVSMCAMLGNFGKPGASYGSFWHLFFGINAAFTMPTGPNTTPSLRLNDFADVVSTGKHRGADFPIKMLFTYMGNPACCGPEALTFINEGMNKCDYVVTVDSAMTDTARYSDIVLPCCQWFEFTDVSYAGQTVSLSYSEKAIDPLYESKTDADIVRGLAKEMGFSQHFDMTDEEVLGVAFDTALGNALNITYDKIKKEGDVRFVADEPHIAYRGGAKGGFSTASGRLEFYFENPAPYTADLADPNPPSPELIEREHLPHWFPPAVAWPENEIMQTYPFILMSERPRFRVHTQWFSTPLLRELDPEPFVKMNPADAEERGFKDGQYVECFNDLGHAVARLVYSDAIRPGTLVYPKGWQRHQHKAGSWSEMVSKQYDPFYANHNFMDVVCDVRAWEGM